MQNSGLHAGIRSPRLMIAAATAAAVAATIFMLTPHVTDAADTKGATVSTARTGLGRILVNSRGRTLYVFGRDKNGKSACSGSCAANWPPMVTSSKPRVTNGAHASLVGTTKRADGRLQVTYNHHPLYTFVKDTRKGQTNGEGFHVFGGEWDVVSPEGRKVAKNSSSSSGGDYSGP